MRTGQFHRVVLCALFVSIGVIAHAQKAKQDAVYLHNGSMVRGEVIERITDSHVKIQTVDGSLWVFQMDEVKEITSVDKFRAQRSIEPSKKGFYSLTDVGAIAGRSTHGNGVAASLQTVGGYRFNEHLSVGGGAGLENFEVGLAPIFGEGRFYLLKRNFSPFIALQGGYSVPINNYEDYNGNWVQKGGVMMNANLGVRNYLSNNVALVISAGFRHQQSSTTTTYWWFTEGDSAVTKHIYNRIVFRIGVMFH